MYAIRLFYGMKKAIRKAIEAGDDIIILGLNTNKQIKLIKYITKLAMCKKIKMSRINIPYNRIIKMKQKYNINDEIKPEPKKEDIDNINNQIKYINNQVDEKKK